MPELLLILFLLFIIGICTGSFLSVIIFRIKNQEKGIIFGRSHCAKCKKKLKTVDLIPLLSFLINKGKCRFCHKKISSLYPLLELVCGFILPFNFLYILMISTAATADTIAFDFQRFIFYSISCLIIIAIAFYDLISKEIPNLFLYSWITFSIITAFVLKENHWGNIGVGLVIALLFFGIQILISRGKWLGSGDVFFAIGMAILLGYERLIVAIVSSYILGSFICLILILTKKVQRKNSIAFTPFLSLGTILALYFGKEIFLWYINNGFINF